MADTRTAAAADGRFEDLLTEARAIAEEHAEHDATFLNDVQGAARTLEVLRDRTQNWALNGVIHDLRTACEDLLAAQQYCVLRANLARSTPALTTAATPLLADLVTANHLTGYVQIFRAAVDRAVRDLTHLRAAVDGEQIDEPLTALTDAVTTRDSASAAALAAPADVITPAARALMAADPFIVGTGAQHEKYGTSEWQGALTQAQALADAGLLRS